MSAQQGLAVAGNYGVIEAMKFGRERVSVDIWEREFAQIDGSLRPPAD